MPKQSGVYRIELGNERFYLGSSVNLLKREATHLQQLKACTHPNRIMQRSFDKYKVFRFTVLELCAAKEVIALEQALLDQHYNDANCANLAPTAGNQLGVKFSAESRARMSAARTGRKGTKHSAETKARLSAAARNRSPEHRAKIAAANRSRGPMSAQTKARMSAAAKGRKFTAEHRAKIGAANLGRKHSPETRAKMRAAWVIRRSRINNGLIT